MRIIIIEDEILMAKDLSQTLKQINPLIEVIKVISSVQEALEFFEKAPAADLIFSDIELEDGLSFEIFKKLNINIPVIFCTAYDEYALEAFKANGIEYILKPFSTTSLKKSLDKIDWLKHTLSDKDLNHNKASADALVAYQNNESNTLMIRFRNKILPFSFSKVALFHIENDVTYVLTLNNQSYAIQYTLDEMEQRAGNDFFRVNRQFLINRAGILETAHSSNRKLSVAFSFPFHREVLVSKEKTTKFLRWLSQ